MRTGWWRQAVAEAHGEGGPGGRRWGRRKWGRRRRALGETVGSGAGFFGDEGFEFADGLGGAVFLGELGGDFGGAASVGGVYEEGSEGEVEVFGPAFFGEAAAAAEAFDLGGEKFLVADMGDDELGDAGVEGAGGGAGAAVVDDGGGVEEELVVGDGADDFDMGVVAELGELSPAALDDDLLVAGPGADEAGHPVAGLFVDHAAEGEDGDLLAAGEGEDLGVEGGVFGGLPAAVAGEAEARVDLGPGGAEEGAGDGDEDAVGGVREEVSDLGQAGGAEGVGDGSVDDAVHHGVAGAPEPAVPSAAETGAKPGGRGDVFWGVVGGRDDVGGEGEGGERDAVAVGDALVHGEEVAGDEQVGLGHDGVHAGDHLGDVGFGPDVDLAELVDGGADFIEAAHPVGEVGLFPVGAEGKELDTGGFDIGAVVGDGGEADGVAGLAEGDGEADDRVDIAGGAVGSEDDAHEWKEEEVKWVERGRRASRGG